MSREARSANRTWGRRLSAVGIGILVACAIAEVALRVGGYNRTYLNPLHSFHEADDVIGARGKRNFRGRFHRPNFDVVVEHDDRGFRKHEYQNEPVSGARDVFVFGDSFTWGWGVEQGEVFTDQMNTLMPGYVVHNFGLNASGTVQQFALFERYVRDELSPGDTVVITFCSNDYYDNLHGRLRAEDRDGQLAVVGPTPFGSKLKDALKEHSLLFNLLAYTTDLIKLQRKQRESAARAVAQTQDQPAPLLAEGSLEVRVTKHFLGKFREACQRNRARLLVVDVGRDPNIPPITQAVGCESIQLQAAFDEAEKTGRVTEWQIPDDGHWNAQGHRIAAEAISARILQADR